MFKNIRLKTKKYYLLFLFVLFLACLFLNIGISFSSNDKPIKKNEYKDTPYKIIQSKDRSNILKVVQVSDVHMDTQSSNKGKRLLADSQILLQDAVNQINLLKDVDMIIFSGDIINRPDEADFIKFLKQANKLKYPWYLATGNHDIAIKGSLTKKKYVSLRNSYNKYINSANTYYSICPKKGYEVIFMDGVIDSKITSNGEFDKYQLEWLRKQLKNYKNDNIIIVQHFPLVEPFRSSSHCVKNKDEYLNLINKYSNLIAVLSGHYHVSKIIEQNSVIHVSTPALVEYPNAFRVINFENIKDRSDKNSIKNIKVNFKFLETTLKELQQKSKLQSHSAELSNGQLNDRETTIILHKN